MSKTYPKIFKFSPENIKKADLEIAKYPSEHKQSAVMALLTLAQKQTGGWLPVPAIEYVADYLEMPYIKVYEVASFYEMYNLEPVGENEIHVCCSPSCYMRGSNEIMEACKSHLKIDEGETTKDKKFTIKRTGCLGACVNAPVVRIGDEYHENLTPDEMIKILDEK